MLWQKRVTVGVFLVLAIVLFGYLLHLYNTQKNDYSSLLHLSSEQLELLQKCAPEEASTLAQISSGVVCAAPNERKHSIVLISAYPNDDSNHFRSLYELITGISTYSPYLEIDSHHSKVCDFQSGPWELYCRGSPSCSYQHPPDWEVPYFVKSVYPMYDNMCDGYGYDLVTHDSVIHIVRNPVDAIYGWFSKSSSTNLTLSNYIAHYYDWHHYWEQYEHLYPSAQVTWIRYEDYCLCPETTVSKVLSLAGIHGTNETKIREVLAEIPCDLAENLGVGIEVFELSDLQILGEYLARVINHFGYIDLFLEMIEHHHGLEDNQPFIDALYPQLQGSLTPTDSICSSLTATTWHWQGVLG